MNDGILPSDYKETLEVIIQKIESAQQKAVISANKTLLDLYWYINETIKNGWARSVLINQIEYGLYG